METIKDFNELLALLNEKGVEYVIVGGYALAFHGAPRTTGDLDILVKPTADNAKRVMEALGEFGFGLLNLTADDFQKKDAVIELGYPPVRVDFLTSIEGVPVEDAFAGKQPGKYGDVPVHFLGREQFITNKSALGRKQDLADLEALGV